MNHFNTQSAFLNYMENPNPDDLGGTVEDFLNYLGKASAILLKGDDSTRTRAVCTLLHGNEPSGVKAVFKYLKSKQTPLVDTLFIIASVEAAMTPPFFSQRMLEGKRDLNRCFSPPFDDHEGHVANAILSLITQVNPECLLDIHNTSGSGPAFAVAIIEDQRHVALASLFSNDLIVSDLRIGALMEISEKDGLTVITIECGGAQDTSSQIIADEGLFRYLSSEYVMGEENEDYPVNIYRNPIRLETQGQAEVAYYPEQNHNAAITLPEQADKFNYGMLTKDESIGYLGPAGITALSAKDYLGKERLHEFFKAHNGKLYPRHPLKVFMVTTNPFIAKTDCLFYFIACV
ncbi:MAG: succinylglutamate desuccinylase/aspartoacylase family protein [Psychromonas sp.]